MEIYIPYLVGSTAVGLFSKGVFNYMYRDNSDIMKMETTDNNNYFEIQSIETPKSIEETIEEPIEETKEETIEETKDILFKKHIDTAYKINKKLKCSCCKNYLKLSSYSKTQNKLGDVRRCKVCIKLSY
jgi:hypothetical protein